MIYAIYGLSLLAEFSAIADYFLRSPEITHRILKTILSILGAFVITSAILLLGL